MIHRRLSLLTGWLAIVLGIAAGVRPSAVQAQQSEPLATANQTFQARCSTCHAEHGEGSEAGASLNVPDLRSSSVQQLPDTQLRHIIQEGKGDMPRFKRDFNDDEITQLIQLLRSFASQKSAPSQNQSASAKP